MKPTIQERIAKFKEANPDISGGLYLAADKISGAVMAKYDDPDSDSWCWVEEIFDGHVIMKKDGKFWRVDYEIVNDEVIFTGDMKEVDKKVTYEGDRSKANGKKREIKETRKTGELFKESSFDTENLIIKNVSLLGADSANGYTYKESALKDAAKLLEGTIQYVNHSFEEIPRDVKDSFSEVKNVRYDSGKQKVFGDMYLVNTPYVREEIFPRVERFSNKFGNSMVAWGDSVEEDGKEFVTAITAVESCDLVSDPATTKGLFESIQNGNKKITGGDNNMLTLEEVRKNKEIMEAIKAEIIKELEDGKKIAALEKENTFLKEELGKKTKENDEYKVKDALNEKRTLIAKLVKEAELPEKAVTTEWIEFLESKCNDEVDIKKSISERKELVASFTANRPHNYERNVDEAVNSGQGNVPDPAELQRFRESTFN